MNEMDTTIETPTEPQAPYDAEMHCRKIAWMGKNSPDWDIENQTLEQYLETSADYPTDAQVAGFNHLWVEPFVPVKREKYQGEPTK
jgi:hypothetical protein